MKNITFLASLLITISGFAQNKTATVSHKGFYLSLALGPAFGNINGSDNFGRHYTVKGTAYYFGTQIGGAIQPNLILHGTIQIQSIYGPNINEINLDDKYSFDENFIGAGITKYSSRNFFITANILFSVYPTGKVATKKIAGKIRKVPLSSENSNENLRKRETKNAILTLVL